MADSAEQQGLLPNAASCHLNQKEEEMNTTTTTGLIYHMLQRRVYDGVEVMIRIMTNVPSEAEHRRYIQSLQTRRPFEDTLAILTGNYQPWMLQKQLADNHIAFRIMILDNEQLKEMDPSRVNRWHDRANYAAARDNSTFFINFYDTDEWGLKPIGLRDQYVKKLGKRLIEIVRLTELYYHSPIADLSVHIADGLPGAIEFYDGMNAISEDLAIKMAANIPDRRRVRFVIGQIKSGMLVRLNIRYLGPEFMGKGDAMIVKDLPYDIVLHPENAKHELRTDGWCSLSAEPHNPFHVAVWDTQSWINNRFMLPESKHRADLDLMITELTDSFKKGVVPEWLLLGEEAHDDDGLPNYERLSELYHHNYMKWQAHGLDVKALQNLIYMATNGVWLRTHRWHRESPVPHYKKTWTLMTNAFLGGIVTHEALRHLCGLDLPNNDGYLTWDNRYGLVMRGERFLDTYNLHGGWDLDDSVKVILVRIWSDDEERTQHLIDYKTLDPKINVPKTMEEAMSAPPVALLVRSPNGPGEYSIEALNPNNWEDMPWHKLNEEYIPVVNLTQVPEPQGALMENVIVRGIPTSISYTNEPMTQAESIRMIRAQMINPGIGAVCNSLMTWSMTFGPSFPNEMLAELESMVDVTQQTHDPVSFEAVSAEVDNLYKQLVARSIAEDRKVDRLLAVAHPIPSAYLNELKPLLTSGRFTRFNQHYAGKVREMRNHILENSFSMRASSDVVRQISRIGLTTETRAWAQRFYNRYNQEFIYHANAWKSDLEEKNPFIKMHFEIQRNKANRDTVSRAAAELREFGGELTYKRVLALWIWILTHPSNRNKGKGKSDRIMAAPGNEDSVMDVLIEALIWRGLANDFTPMEKE